MTKALEKMAEKIRQIRKPKQLSLEDYAAKLIAKGLNPDGTVMADPVPMAPPIGYKKHPSMVEIVRDMVRSERLAQEVAASGSETFEESEDFDIDDEYLLHSQWENDFDPPLSEILKAGQEAIAAREAQSEDPAPPQPSDSPKAAKKKAVEPPSDGPDPTAE